MKRRRILFGAGMMVTTVVAGCLTDGKRHSGAGSPAEAVEEYFLALADDNHELANRYTHPDGDYYIDDNNNPFPSSDIQGLTIDETEVVDVEEGIQQVYKESKEERMSKVVEEEKAALEKLQSEYGFDEYAYVHIIAETEVTEINLVFVLFEDDDSWIIWSGPTFSHKSQQQSILMATDKAHYGRLP